MGPGGSAEESNMRAAFITGYGDNSVVCSGEIADPTPGADEALIEVRAAGTNPVEISMREGHFKATLPFSFPQVMGYDTSGIVASAPAGSAFKAMRSTLGYPTAGLVLMPSVPLFPLASWPANLDLFPLKKPRVFRRSH